MSTVYVCPERDIECGNRPANWCDKCPQRTDSNRATEAQPEPNVLSRLMEMSDIIRAGSRWNGNEQEFAAKEESDVAMLDDILSDAIRIASSVAARDLDVEAERREFREAVRKLYEPHMGPEWEIMLYSANGGDFAFKVWLAARAPSNNSPVGGKESDQ